MATSSDLGVSKTLASKTGSPSKSYSPDQVRSPDAVEGFTVIDASICDWPLLCPSSPEMFTIVSDSQVEP